MLPVKQFVEFIEDNQLFNTGTKILAAVSGGIDSVLMAHLLKAAGYDFSIAHVNFMLRGAEALADQEFTRSLAQQLGVRFHTTSFNTAEYAATHQVSIQMAARDLRYQWFNQLCHTAGYGVISLAHHQNDAIETILLNLTRGTGIAGLHGILPHNGNLVRPLLFLSRREIEAVVARENLAYTEDASNASAKYARNKIRHQVLPLLRELNPSIEQTFEQNLQNLRELEQLLQLKVADLRNKMVRTVGDDVHIGIEELKQLQPKHLLMYHLLKPYGFTDTLITDLISALDKHPGRLFATAGYSLVVDRENVIISKRKLKADEVKITINADDHELTYQCYRVNLLHDDSPLIVKNNPLAASVDAGLLVYPLTMRGWQQGDQFYPLGMRTRQKISDFFVHQKVPVSHKSEVPILVNGNGDIIWIGGYRLSERYKVTHNTKKVTIFELIKI